MFSFPFVGRNQVVGLFGGTFDPPHAGHLLAANRALQRVGLDQLWWIPSPGNPLKSRQPAPVKERIARIEALGLHPKMRIVDAEGKLGTHYTIDTIGKLRQIYPQTRFVLVFGADILTELHRWKNWRELVKVAPICTIARPHEQIRAGLSPFAQSFARFRIDAEDAQLLKTINAPAWAILPGPMVDISSTELRAQNGTN